MRAAVEAVAEAARADDAFASVSAVVRRLVPFDAAAWFGADPASLFPAETVRVEGIESRSCSSHWDDEYRIQDVLLYRDLARAAVAAGSLLSATGDRPERSARYRGFLAGGGYGDELRAALRTGGRTWGFAGLYRERGRPPFTPREVETFLAVAPGIAAALRSRAAVQLSGEPRAGSGIALFSRTGDLISFDDRAAHWFGSLAGDRWGDRTYRMASVDSVVAHAAAAREGRAWGDSVVRLRVGHGWLSVSASALTASNGAAGPVAVTVAPSAPPLEAYGLTAREQEVTRAVALGMSTQDIAMKLNLSSFTVRDHLKAIFAKLAVKSRSELSAALTIPHL